MENIRIMVQVKQENIPISSEEEALLKRNKQAPGFTTSTGMVSDSKLEKGY